jgi:hypothetical protein
VKELKISALSSLFVVCGGKNTFIGQPHFQNANNMAAVGRVEKLIPALKINILWDMVNSIPYLVPTQFQDLIFPKKTRPKIPARN